MSQLPPIPQADPAPARPGPGPGPGPTPRRRSATAALATLAILALAASSPLLPLASHSETNTAATPTLPGTATNSVVSSNLPPGPDATASPTSPSTSSQDPAPAKSEDSTTQDSATSRSDRESRRNSRRSSSGSDRRSDERSSRRGDRSSASPGETNAPAGSTGTDFASFKIIGERNIFNPNRGRASARTDREPTRKATQVDHFSLVGTLSYAKGDFAFFDGSSSTYRKTLKCGDAIAGYTVKAISANAVQLASGESPLEMPIGSQLRREDEGEWKFIARSEATGSSSSSSSSLSGSSSSSRGDRSAPTGDSAGAANDILLKLMKKREQEK